MKNQKKLPVHLSMEELDKELIARAAQIPPDQLFKFSDSEGTPQRTCIMEQVKQLHTASASLVPNAALSHLSTCDLVRTLRCKTQEVSGTRGIWYEDDRMDVYEIEDRQVLENTNCVAAICKKEFLIHNTAGFSTLKVKSYGKAFNLSDREPFRTQPISSGRLCTGFLVKEDMIATAAHFAGEHNVTDLRIVFGYNMSDLSTPVIRIPDENIYNGEKIAGRVYNYTGNKSDWALVKLDRKVKGQKVAALSKKEILCNQPVYILGHPAGLPLKYAPGANVSAVNDIYFTAGLDVYSGNSGSPVFDSDTHEVVGMAVRGHNSDFRWSGNGWVSVIYPNRDISSTEAQCTRVSEFLAYCL